MCTMYDAIMMIKCLDERLIKIISHVMQMKNNFELNIFTFLVFERLAFVAFFLSAQE